MKTLPTLTGSLVLSVLLLTAQAQAPATSHDNPTPAKPTTKMAKGSKSIERKMVEKSKPTDMLVPHPCGQ